MRWDCRALLVMVAIVLVVATTTAPDVGAQCVSGTITSEFQTDGPFTGLYKYTIVMTWDTYQGLSNITLDCGFGQCPDQVCYQTFAFDTPSGLGEGIGGCLVQYQGEFNCQGNPSIGYSDPVLKWDAIGECEPDNEGMATLCFYTTLGPQPGCSAPVLLIKNGQNVCQGTIEGDCPAPPCIVGTESTSWGEVKSLYR